MRAPADLSAETRRILALAWPVVLTSFNWTILHVTDVVMSRTRPFEKVPTALYRCRLLRGTERSTGVTAMEVSVGTVKSVPALGTLATVTTISPVLAPAGTTLVDALSNGEDRYVVDASQTIEVTVPPMAAVILIPEAEYNPNL